MHDVHTLERKAAVPTLAIVTTTFAKQALYQAEALGLSDACTRRLETVGVPCSTASGC